MAAGVFPFLVGVQLSLRESIELSEKFFYILIAIFIGCFLGKGRRKILPCYDIEIRRENTDTHLLPYKIAFLLAVMILTVFFLRRGIPLFSEEPNIAKVTITREGGWVITRFIRYFLPMLFYASILYSLQYAGKYLSKKKSSVLEIFRGSRKTWLFIGFTVLISFAFFGYKSNVIAFFLRTICFVSLLVYLNLRRAIPFLVAGLAVFLLMVMIAQRSDTLSEIIMVIYQRSIGADGFIYIISHYGRDEPFLLGEGLWYDFSNVLLRLGLQPIIPVSLHELNFDALMFERLLGHNEYKMQTVTALFGQLYANFGLFVTVLGTSLYYFLHTRFGNFLITHKKSLLGTPVYFFLFWQYQTFAIGGPVVITLLDTVLSLIMFFSIYVGVYLFLYLPLGRLSFKIP